MRRKRQKKTFEAWQKNISLKLKKEQNLNEKKLLKKKENLLTAIFIGIGVLSLLRYYFLPLK